MVSSWQRAIAEHIGVEDDDGSGSWLRRVAFGIGSINGETIVLGSEGSWARRILENYTGYLPEGSWERKLRYLYDDGISFVALGGGGASVPSDWILATGSWSDSGSWVDTENWQDS